MTKPFDPRRYADRLRSDYPSPTSLLGEAAYALFTATVGYAFGAYAVHLDADLLYETAVFFLLLTPAAITGYPFIMLYSTHKPRYLAYIEGASIATVRHVPLLTGLLLQIGTSLFTQASFHPTVPVLLAFFNLPLFRTRHADRPQPLVLTLYLSTLTAIARRRPGAALQIPAATNLTLWLVIVYAILMTRIFVNTTP